MSKKRSQNRCSRCFLWFLGHWVIDLYSARRSNIEKKIMESIKAQVKVEVAEWGQSPATKRLIESLKNMTEGNNVLVQDAQTRLDNS